MTFLLVLPRGLIVFDRISNRLLIHIFSIKVRKGVFDVPDITGHGSKIIHTVLIDRDGRHCFGQPVFFIAAGDQMVIDRTAHAGIDSDQVLLYIRRVQFDL